MNGDVMRGASQNVAEPVCGSSFYAALRVLPRAQRDAMFQIYGFCRAVDDVADGRGDRRTRLAQLAQWRSDVDALFAGAPPRRLRGLAAPVQAFDLQRDDFLSIIAGMEMDVSSDIRAPELATLDIYCDRVACAVGRLSVRVFGISAQDGASLALHLGRALQLTNILRDLDEDAEKGRLYLPREALVDAGIHTTDPVAVLGHPSLGRACAAVVALAQSSFDEASRVMARWPPSIVRAPMLMANVYQHILRRLAARGWVAPREPVRAGRTRLLWILLRHGIFEWRPPR